MYDRIKLYEEIHHKVDKSNISNLANLEMAISFVEIIYRDGIEYLKQEILVEQNLRLVRKLLCFLLAFDRDFSINLYEKFVKEGSPDFLLIEPYGLKEFRTEECYFRAKQFIANVSKKVKKV